MIYGGDLMKRFIKNKQCNSCNFSLAKKRTEPLCTLESEIKPCNRVNQKQQCIFYTRKSFLSRFFRRGFKCL